MQRHNPVAASIWSWLAAVALLLAYGLAMASLVEDSPVYDEQSYITRGLGYLRGENRHMRVGHPLGLNALSASFLVYDSTVRLPLDDPSWAETSFHRPAELFLWEIGNDVEHIMFLARLPTVWLGMLLAAVAGRWSYELTRRREAALFCLVLLAFDPNILAHTRLATTDLGIAAGATLAGYTLWRFLDRPNWGRGIMAGVIFGLLQNTKFNAGLFVPLFGFVILVCMIGRWRVERRFPWGLTARLVITYPAAAFLTLWACYGFEIGTLPAGLPLFPQLAGQTLPLAHHLEQLLDIGGRVQKSTPSFLLGRYSDHGWWYYFPVAFLLKTPIPTLAVIGWALVKSVSRANRRVAKADQAVSHFALLIVPAGYFIIALTSQINLGYRHLLPMLPFLAVWVSTQAPLLRRWAVEATTGGALLLICLVLAPHHLAYFNLFAGGPQNGWRALVDSNLDWGQDLAGLRRWMVEHEVPHVWLSYFGEARPEYYGIDYLGLESYPPRLMNPEARPFLPSDPAPGIYAISATNLQGVLFENHDLYAWFREREVLAKVGYSIFVYSVDPHGAPAELALGGLQPDEMQPSDVALLETNDVGLAWFDPGTALVMPSGEQRWLALADDPPLHPLLWPLVADGFHRISAGTGYTLYQGTGLALKGPDAQWWFTQDCGQIALLEYQVGGAGDGPDNGPLTLVTHWRQMADPAPVKIFVHAVAADGRIVSQWDGLGAVWQGWRRGSELVQVHPLPAPADGTAGRVDLWLGLYHPESMARWETEGRDRVWLGAVELP